MMFLRKRRLYRQATQAWRDGHSRDRSLEPKNRALAIAFHAGTQHGPRDRELLLTDWPIVRDMPVEVWSLVLAEEARP